MMRKPQARFIAIAVLAFIAALIAALVALQIRSWVSSLGSGVSDEDKQEMLERLGSTSRPSVPEMKTILDNLSKSSTKTMTEQEKLQVLQTLKK